MTNLMDDNCEMVALMGGHIHYRRNREKELIRRYDELEKENGELKDQLRSCREAKHGVIRQNNDASELVATQEKQLKEHAETIFDLREQIHKLGAENQKLLEWLNRGENDK